MGQPGDCSTLDCVGVVCGLAFTVSRSVVS